MHNKRYSYAVSSNSQFSAFLFRGASVSSSLSPVEVIICSNYASVTLIINQSPHSVMSVAIYFLSLNLACCSVMSWFGFEAVSRCNTTNIVSFYNSFKFLNVKLLPDACTYAFVRACAVKKDWC